MNGSTARLLRKYSHLTGSHYRTVKRNYKKVPRPQRYDVKQEIRLEIVRLTALKENQDRAAESESEQSLNQSFNNSTNTKEESVVPIHSRPAAGDPAASNPPERSYSWLRGLWEWLKRFVPLAP